MDRAFARRTVRAGLLGGVALVYLFLVGMIPKLNSINILEDKMSFGRVLILLSPIFAGFLLARPRIRSGEVEQIPTRLALLGGVVAGAMTGGLAALGIGVVHLFPDGAVRNIFASVTEPSR